MAIDRERRADRRIRSGVLLRSSSFRLSLLYMALFGTSVLILLAFIYWASTGYMSRQSDATIEAEIQGLAEQYQRRGLAGLTSLIAERLSRNPSGSSVYLLADPGYVPLLGNLRSWPAAAPPDADWLDFRLPPKDAQEQGHPARARQFDLRGGFHLLVGRDVQELERARSLTLRALAGGLGVTLVLALIGGAAMSRSMLRKIELINDTSREIMRGQLSRRIPYAGTGDDFDQLAGNLNAMLDRIEALMEDVRRVSDNVAHDLRTPLTRLRMRLERLCADDTESALAAEALAEADALLGTFNALLRIARVESGNTSCRRAPIPVAKLLADVSELYEPVAEARGQRLSVHVHAPPDLELCGDRDLLFQALANLLDNATKYTPCGGSIRLSAAERTAYVLIEVNDSGPGIAPALHDRVLQRFYRCDGSRATPGNGLGLSLVAAIMQRHAGSIRLGSGPEGLCVRLTLPRASRAPLPASPACSSKESPPFAGELAPTPSL